MILLHFYRKPTNDDCLIQISTQDVDSNSNIEEFSPLIDTYNSGFDMYDDAVYIFQQP